MAATRSNGKAKAAPNPAIKRLIDHYHDKFLERHGFPPDPSEYGRFGKWLGPQLSAYGEADIRALIDEFLNDRRDPRVIRTTWRMSDFMFLAQYLRMRRNGSHAVLDRRTADNIAAAERASTPRASERRRL